VAQDVRGAAIVREAGAVGVAGDDAGDVAHTEGLWLAAARE
jgi:hypothetical protein